MKRSLLSVLCLSCGVGCSASPRDGADFAKVPLPIRGLHSVFREVARREGLRPDADTLLNLAADSTIHRWRSPDTGRLVIVKPSYYGTECTDYLRGAQENGSFYVFRMAPRGHTLVGVFAGNSCHIRKTGQSIDAVTTWHCSATEYTERLYVWRGAKFVQEPLPPAARGAERPAGAL
jgi:hypothetical protein